MTKKKAGYNDILTESRQSIMKEEVYEASDAQLQSWLIQHKNKTIGKATEHLALKFVKQGINIPALEKSIASIIKRHESLRTSFGLCGDQLIQKIAPYDEDNFKIEIHEIKRLESQDHTINSITEKGNKCLDDLHTVPLLKMYIFHLPDETYLFKLFLNHIIADVPSLSLLKDEINSFYKSYVSNQELQLQDLKIQLKDYIKHQNRIFTSKKESYKKFWNDRIGSLSRVIDWGFAFDKYTRSTGHTINCPKIKDNISIFDALENGLTAEFGLYLDKVFYDGLENISLHYQTGISSSLYTSLFILFYLIDNQERVLIASPVSLRASTPGISSVIANFDAGIYLRSELNEDQQFSKFLTRTYTDFIKSYRHAITNYESLDLNAQLLRTNCTAYLNFQHKGIIGKPNKTAFSEGHRINGSSLYMLTYEVTQTEDGYNCTWYYNTSIFPSGFIEWMALVHKKILTAVIQNPDITIRELKSHFNFSDSESLL
ncbi:hypothetical protein AY601_3530 [Pedobacter cryoconitis]|uniref:Condensation domain-containing protein n=1 Tax=Pedobacter cryoconitis TaxID=188932 RepID=A0A127VGF3_9SPHI|nr:condensation domain-containing protein [Pedobacter cryoconitis]AMQ00396.1 hypothetical protein AY601_3530 [Pedobacter cryoconitis]